MNIFCSADSPLLWVRADPEMEYLAEINFNQPVQMWVSMSFNFIMLFLRNDSMVHQLQ